MQDLLQNLERQHLLKGRKSAGVSIILELMSLSTYIYIYTSGQEFTTASVSA